MLFVIIYIKINLNNIKYLNIIYIYIYINNELRRKIS